MPRVASPPAPLHLFIVFYRRFSPWRGIRTQAPVSVQDNGSLKSGVLPLQLLTFKAVAFPTPSRCTCEGVLALLCRRCSDIIYFSPPSQLSAVTESAFFLFFVIIISE